MNGNVKCQNVQVILVWRK